MALSDIKSGLKVFTNARVLSTNGEIRGTVGGGVEGIIAKVIRHPTSRNVLAVVVNPGVESEDDYLVISPRNLRKAAA